MLGQQVTGNRAENAGQPQPESNLSRDENSGLAADDVHVDARFKLLVILVDERALGSGVLRDRELPQASDPRCVPRTSDGVLRSRLRRSVHGSSRQDCSPDNPDDVPRPGRSCAAVRPVWPGAAAGGRPAAPKPPHTRRAASRPCRNMPVRYCRPRSSPCWSTENGSMTSRNSNVSVREADLCRVKLDFHGFGRIRAARAYLLVGRRFRRWIARSRPWCP